MNWGVFIFHLALTMLIWLCICLPLQLLSIPVVAILLRTSWSGRTTIFGNEKWGRGTDHFEFPTKGYWSEFNWLVLRNPVHNLTAITLAAMQKPYVIMGDWEVGDKIKGGFQYLRMGIFWEYYWIRPYTVFGSRRCIRFRMGWKIRGNDTPLAAFCFAPNPVKSYTGV